VQTAELLLVHSVQQNPSGWNFLSPAQAVTWRTVAIIIQVILLSPYFCICGISLSSILPLTLRWVEAESLYKTNTVIKVNPIENMWCGVKRTMQETWPVLPPRNSDELWDLVSDVWDEAASSQRYIQSLIESMTRWMKSVVEAEGFWTLLKLSIFENSPFKGESINFHFLWIGAKLHRSQWPGGLRTLACWDCGFESHQRHGCLSFVSVVCCLSYIKTYADSGTRINIVYFWSNIRVLNVTV